jgi:hypothetical protein
MPISQSVRPTATVQALCTEGTLARGISRQKKQRERAATSRRRRNRHEQTQLQQHRQPVSVFLQSAADDRQTSRWKRPSTPAPHDTGPLPGPWTSHHPRLSAAAAAAAAAHLHARPRPTRPCAQPQPDGDGAHRPTLAHEEPTHHLPVCPLLMLLHLCTPALPTRLCAQLQPDGEIVDTSPSLHQSTRCRR